MRFLFELHILFLTLSIDHLTFFRSSIDMSSKTNMIHLLFCSPLLRFNSKTTFFLSVVSLTRNRRTSSRKTQKKTSKISTFFVGDTEKKKCNCNICLFRFWKCLRRNAKNKAKNCIRSHRETETNVWRHRSSVESSSTSIRIRYAIQFCFSNVLPSFQFLLNISQKMKEFLLQSTQCFFFFSFEHSSSDEEIRQSCTKTQLNWDQKEKKEKKKVSIFLITKFDRHVFFDRQ